MNRRINRRMIVAVTIALAALSSLSGCTSALPSLSPQPTHTSQPNSAQFTLRTVAGYLTPWDARSVGSLDEDVLTEVSPVWYQPTASGQVIFASRQAQQSQANVTAQAMAHSVALTPTISNYVDDQWSGDIIHTLITNATLRAAHIAAITQLVQANPWAGIDIDYESLRASDRQAYSVFIADLADALHHVGRRLTLTVHAKTSEPGDWSGARAQDWRALGAAADEVRVMAYDYSTDSSSAGPIAPAPWVKSVLALAVTEIPREKVVLGLATYGYDWASGQTTQDVQWADAEALARSHKATIQWDVASQSPWFTYTDARGRRHTVWYTNARSLSATLALAMQSRVGGVFLWRLGGEDPAIWPLLRQAQ